MKNNLKVEIYKPLEFIFALCAMYVVVDPDCHYTDYDFIEVPPVKYFDDIKDLFSGIDVLKYREWMNKHLIEQGDFPKLGIALDDEMNLKYVPNFDSEIPEEELYKFCGELKELYNKVNWNKFYNEHKDQYDEFINEFSAFPEDLDMDEFIKLYGIEPNSFVYNPSVLMNGGFGISDDSSNFYYLRGFIYNKEEKKYRCYIPAIVECLFHEFSHPIVNGLVDKHFDKLEDPFRLYDYSVENKLHPGYSGDVRTVYYEYMVRTVAYYLTLTYYPDYDIDMEYNSSFGFGLLDKFVVVLSDAIATGNYKNYEDIYVNVIIPYINNLELDKKRAL